MAFKEHPDIAKVRELVRKEASKQAAQLTLETAADVVGMFSSMPARIFKPKGIAEFVAKGGKRIVQKDTLFGRPPRRPGEVKSLIDLTRAALVIPAKEYKGISKLVPEAGEGYIGHFRPTTKELAVDVAKHSGKGPEMGLATTLHEFAHARQTGTAVASSFTEEVGEAMSLESLRDALWIEFKKYASRMGMKANVAKPYFYKYLDPRERQANTFAAEAIEYMKRAKSFGQKDFDILFRESIQGAIESGRLDLRDLQIAKRMGTQIRKPLTR